jgi:hypothetical protein
LRKVFTIKIKNHDTFTIRISAVNLFYHKLFPVRRGYPGQTDRAKLLALVLDLTFSTNHLYHYTAVSLGYKKRAGGFFPVKNN